jgi:hypothetical protein
MDVERQPRQADGQPDRRTEHRATPAQRARAIRQAQRRAHREDADGQRGVATYPRKINILAADSPAQAAIRAAAGSIADESPKSVNPHQVSIALNYLTDS